MSESEADLDALEAAAKAATPGPWRRNGSWIDAGQYDDVLAPDHVECGAYCNGGSSRIEMSDADAEFIVAANPSAVLALIGRVRALEWADGVKRVIDAERREKAAVAGRMSVVTLDIEILDEWFDALYDLDQDEAVEMLKNELRSIGARES